MSKLTRACIALAAFMTFALLPATASATNNPQLTTPEGTLLAANSAISASNVGHTALTNANTEVLTECATASMSGTLTKNDHTGVEVDITAAELQGNTEVVNHGTHCKGSFGPFLVTTSVENGLPYCLRSTPAMATDTFEVRGGTCNEASRELRFTFDVTSSFGTTTCHYGRTTTISGTYTTHPQGAVLSLRHQKIERKTGSSFLCPAETYVDMSLALKSGVNTVYVGDVT